MSVVGNLVCQISELRLQARLLPRLVDTLLIDKTLCNPAGLACFNLPGITAGAMLQYSLSRLKSQIQTVVSRVTLFKRIHHAQALEIVLKARAVRVVVFKAFIQGILSSMAERRMAQVVRQRNRFNQVFVQIQAAGNRAAQLRNFK